MGRARKQQHGKPSEGKSSSSASANTRQAATSFKHHEYLAEQRKAIVNNHKPRGNGKRYCYNGIKGKYPHAEAHVSAPIAALAG